MQENYDDIVIGAGIAGTATALNLLMRGRKVLLLDRRGAGTETSYGNAGIIGNDYILPFGFPSFDQVPDILLGRSVAARVHYPSLIHYLPWLISFYLKSSKKAQRSSGQQLRPLCFHALDEHRKLMRGTDAEKHLSTAGRITLYRQQASFEKDAYERNLLHEAGIPSEALDAAALREIEPSVNPVFYKAVRWPTNVRLDNPGAVVTAYAERFTKEGGTFLKANVSKIEPTNDNRWWVESAQGTFRAKNVVICTGPWADTILEPLGYSFPMAFKRGYHKHYAAKDGAKLSHALFDADVGYYLAPMEQGYRLTTGAEFADRDAPHNPVQIEAALPFAREVFPLGEALEGRAWCGSRPCFADSLPVIGPASKHAGLWFNFGHGHIGLTIGPPSGRLLAEMMVEAAPFCDPYPYRAARFGC